MHWTNGREREWGHNTETSHPKEFSLFYRAHCNLKRLWKRWDPRTYLPFKVSSSVQASSCSNSRTSFYKPPALAPSLLSRWFIHKLCSCFWWSINIHAGSSSHTLTKCYWRWIKHNKTESLNVLPEEAPQPPSPCLEEHANCLRYKKKLTPSC